MTALRLHQMEIGTTKWPDRKSGALIDSKSIDNFWEDPFWLQPACACVWNRKAIWKSLYCRTDIIQRRRGGRRGRQWGANFEHETAWHLPSDHGILQRVARWNIFIDSLGVSSKHIVRIYSSSQCEVKTHSVGSGVIWDYSVVTH